VYTVKSGCCPEELMLTDKKHPSEYLNELEEWQEHQYNPGHWVGHPGPHYFAYGGKRMAPILLGIGIISLVSAGFVLIAEKIDITNIMSVIMPSIMGLLLVLAGIKRLKC